MEEKAILNRENKVSAVSLILKIGVVLSVFIGVFATGSDGGFMQRSMYLFFTIQSNLWIGAICLVFLCFDLLSRIKGKTLEKPQILYLVKYVFTVAISLTFVVFSILLTPQMVAAGNAAYLASASNICCHNLTPILAILDFVFFDKEFTVKKKTFVWGITMPLYYVFFALISSFCGVDFGDGAKVPYFFFDYDANGWLAIGNGKFGVIYWIVILGVAVAFMGYGLIKLNRYILSKRETKSA